MQGRSLSKQNRPHGHNMQMAAYHEPGGAAGATNIQGQHVPGYAMPTSISARKGYPRDQQPMVAGMQQSSNKLTAPIKSLQQKHKHLEMQLARLSQEMANQHERQQQEADQRRKYIKPASNAPHINYTSPMDRQLSAGNPAGPIGHNLAPNSKAAARLTSKDRSGSGNKRFKPSSNVNLKVTSPQRSEKMTLGSQSSTSKLDRDKQLKEIIQQKNIIGHLKKPSDSRVIVKIASKGAKASSSSANLVGSQSAQGTPMTTILNQKSQMQQQRGAGGAAGNSATRQYYAVNNSAGGAPAQMIDLSSQQHNVSVSNGSSRATNHHQYGNNNFSNTVGASSIPPQQDPDLNQQLMNLHSSDQKQHEKFQGVDGDDDGSLRESFEHDQHAGATPVNRQQLRGASGPRYPQSRHFDAPQPYSNLQNRQQRQHQQTTTNQQQMSPERGVIPNSGNNPLFYRQQVNNFVMSSDASQQNAAELLGMSNSVVGGYPPVSVQQPAPSSDIVRNLEAGILSLHGHLKTLEGKYIDLANYYKQELIQSSSSNTNFNNQSAASASITDPVGLQESQTAPSGSKMLRPSSSSTSNHNANSTSQQRKNLQGSAKRAASRESASTLTNNQHQYNLRKQMTNDLMKRTTPRLEGRSFSKVSATGTGIRNFEEYKDGTGAKRQQSKNYRLDQAQERCIIEEVKSQKQKLENEMRNLINLYSQICEEDVLSNNKNAPLSPGLAGLKPFLSHYSTNNNTQVDEQQFRARQNEILSQILFKYQNQLLTQSEYQESFERSVEKTFEELFEEVSDFVGKQMNEVRAQSASYHQMKGATIGRLPALSLMDRIEKLGGDYDIQQEYSLSNLKETMYQIQHTNDQFQLDLKKISLDFSQIQKKLQIQDNQEQAELHLDELVGSLDQVSNGINSMSNRVLQNEQKLQFLQENHGESVRYLREYRENFRRISSEYALEQKISNITSNNSNTNNANQLGDMSQDQMSVNQSYGNAGGNNASLNQRQQHAEITQLNQEIFSLRAQLADAKQNGLIDLNELRDQLDLLTSENASLHGKVVDFNQELQTKTSQLTQREQQNAELMQQLNQPAVHVQTAQIFEDFWRQNCQSMVDLCQKFLHSMRRLQKVVHRKETNVQQEKQDFETAKKELETNLKEVKRQLENQQSYPSSAINAAAFEVNNEPGGLGQAGARPNASTSARPFIPLPNSLGGNSSVENVVQQNSQQNQAQSMRVHQPTHQFSSPAGHPLLRHQMSSGLTSGADPEFLQKQASEQPSKQLQQAPSVVHLEQQISDLKTENLSTNKSLKKERQKVQNLLNELKVSQENLNKYKLTYVPQENVNELESSVKQLQVTIRGHESQDQEQKKLIQELKMSVNDKQMNIYELTRLANEQQNKAKPDYSAFIQAVQEQVNEIVQGQGRWLQSIEQHIANKEEQVSEMVESVEQVSRTLAEKNETIRALFAENEQLNALVQEQDQASAQQKESFQGEVSKLRGELKVKLSGNKMMCALMRGFKQKLEEEMARNREIIEGQQTELSRKEINIKNQQDEIQQFSQVVQQQNQRVEMLQAKIDKKKFKSTQSKQLMANSEQSMHDLQSQVSRANKQLQQKEQAENELQGELGKLQGELKVKKSGNLMMNALMRGLKQKLDEEMARNREIIEDQQNKLAQKEINIKAQQEEIQQFSQVVQQQNQRVELLQSKIDKKKFKSTQSKQLMANSEQSMQDLQSQVLRSQKQLEQKEQSEAEVQAEMSKLRGELKVRQNGNQMMNALMRGLKQKLDEEMAKNRQIIESQQNDLAQRELDMQSQQEEIQQFSQIVQEQTQTVELLQAKIEKKKFKQTQSKRLVADSEQSLNELQNQVKSAQKTIQQKEKAETGLQSEVSKLRGELKVKMSGNKMMNALMLGFKQKLDEEMARNRQTIQNLSNEIQEQAQADEKKSEAIQTLQAKLNQKKFKSAQTKQILAEKTEQLDLLQTHSHSSDQAFEQLRSQNAKLQGTLKVKAAGNQMMNALMRGFKQKLEDEMARSRKVIEDQKHQMTQSSNEVKTLRAKVEKKKFKQMEIKQHVAKMQSEQQAVHGQKRAAEEQLGQVEAEKQTAKQELEEVQTELVELQELFDQENNQLQAQVKELEGKLVMTQQEKDDLREAARDQVKEAREQQAKLSLETATVEQLEAAGNQATVFEISELRIENAKLKQINDERDAQCTDYNNKLTESNLIASKLQNSLESLKNDHKTGSDALNRELETMRDTLTKSESKMAQLRQEAQTEASKKEEAQRALEERMAELAQMEERNAALVSQHEAFKAEQEGIQKDLRQDRDTAQAQLSDFVNQHKFEKESLEGKLQHQLNQTLAQLNAREDECEDLQRQLNALKEAHSQQEIELNEKTSKLDKRKAKVAQMKAVSEGQEAESRGDKAALEQSRELVVQFKAKLQANEELIGAKDEEIQNLRSRVESLTSEVAEKTNQVTEHADDLYTVQGELQSKIEEITRALAQVDAFQAENERVSTENAQFKDQISQLKLEFETKASSLENEAIAERQKAKEKDELITEAEALLADFNNEKHEVKAKFKHLMQLLALKAAGSEVDDSNEAESRSNQSPSRTLRASNPSSYKGRAGEVDLNHCFGELEQIVLEFKAKQESRIVELISDKEQLTGTVHEQKQDLEAMQVSLANLQEKLDEANGQVESNDGEARRQIDTAMRKITNYKEKLTGKKQSVASLEQQVAALTAQLMEAQANAAKVDISDKSGMEESYLELKKENQQLLERLQKQENKLSKARGGEAVPAEEEETKQGSGGKITMSPEVTLKLNEIDARMVEIQRDLHQAKSSCLKDMMTKYNEQLKSAQKAFASEHLLLKAINGDKVTGWNNIVKECKSIQFADKQFILVQDVSESNFYLVDLDRVTETATKYLKAFIEEYSDEEFIQDVVGRSMHDMDEDPEIEKLKALVTDLRQDRIELQSELEQFRESGKMDTSRIAKLKDEEMKDDIEYLTAENKELSLKVKMVCETKANLQLQLAQIQKRLRIQEEQQDMSAIGIGSIDRKLNPGNAIETARNIDDEMFAPVPESHEESSRMPDRGPKDYLSDQDSVIDVVNQMSREEDEIDMPIADDLQNDNSPLAKQYRLKLDKLESENLELRQKLSTVEKQLETLNEKNDSENEDGGSLIPHIKVTLIQFLRNVPFTDRQNEDLLTIIFNMMEFTDVEITDVKMSRTAIKMPKGKGGRAASSSIGPGGAAGNSTNSMSRDDEGTGKPKRGGIFGMFNKKKGDQNQSGNNQSGGGSMPPAMRPKPAPRR